MRFIVLFACLWSLSADADVLVSTGPTLPLIQYRPGNPRPINLAPGAGVQVSLSDTGLQKAILGKAWDLVDLTFMAFGSAVSTNSGASFGALSVGAGVGFLSSLIVVGGGHDVVTGSGMASGWFGLLSLNLNVALAPTAPPAGVMNGPAGLPRANTLYLY